MLACVDRRPAVRRQFTVINYGLTESTSPANVDDVDDQEDFIAVGARRSGTQVRHGPPSAAARLPSPHRALPGDRPLRDDDEFRHRAPPRRVVTGRHFSGGHVAPPPLPFPLLPSLPYAGPRARTTCTTVVRARHFSDELQGNGSAVVDGPTTQVASSAPMGNGSVVVPIDRGSDSSREDAAGDAVSTVVDVSVGRKLSSRSSDDRRSSNMTSVTDESFRRTVDVARLPEVARRGRLFAKRYRRRLMLQSGLCNVSYANVDRRGARLLMDMFTTLLEMKWRYNILVYLVTFVLSWVLFALLWWAMQTWHGGEACVVGVQDFTTALLFSIETQHTIGYGSRAVTDRCSGAVILLMFQSVFGAVTQCIVTGIIFAKMARPKGRAETVIFSHKAVICRDADGTLCLSFRVGDVRSSQLIGVRINALLVRKTADTAGHGHHVRLHQEFLRIATETGDDFFFLAWPLKIVHHIDETSPLWELSPEALLMTGLEIMVILEACCEATGTTTQVRTSYLPSEILWGHDLAPLLTFQKDNGRYKVDFSQFHNVVAVDTPDMSAKDMASAADNVDSKDDNDSCHKASTDSPAIQVADGKCEKE